MEYIAEFFQSLFATYGLKAATIVIITIIFVNLLKRPIVTYAKRYSLQTGRDKAEITQYITFLPIALSFVTTFLWDLIAAGFNFSAINYGELVSSALMYSAMSVATFETIKKYIEAYSSRKNSRAANALTSEDGDKPTDPQSESLSEIPQSDPANDGQLAQIDCEFNPHELCDPTPMPPVTYGEGETLECDARPHSEAETQDEEEPVSPIKNSIDEYIKIRFGDSQNPVPMSAQKLSEIYLTPSPTAEQSQENLQH